MHEFYAAPDVGVADEQPGPNRGGQDEDRDGVVVDAAHGAAPCVAGGECEHAYTIARTAIANAPRGGWRG